MGGTTGTTGSQMGGGKGTSQAVSNSTPQQVQPPPQQPAVQGQQPFQYAGLPQSYPSYVQQNQQAQQAAGGQQQVLQNQQGFMPPPTQFAGLPQSYQQQAPGGYMGGGKGTNAPAYGGFSPGLIGGSYNVSPLLGLLGSVLMGRGGYAHGGAPVIEGELAPDPSDKIHSGAIDSPVAGRTDHLPIHVASGSYVIPADIISAMGEGNTAAGFKVAKSIFSAPHGLGIGSMPHEAVPVVVAGGEYIITPEEVVTIGGSLDAGHKVLDEFVKEYRSKTIKTLKELPGPKKN